MANNLSIFLRDMLRDCLQLYLCTTAARLKMGCLCKKMKNSCQILTTLGSYGYIWLPEKSSAGPVKTHFSVLQSRLGQHCIRHTENKIYNSKRLSMKLLHRESHQIVSAELTFLCQLRQRRQLVAVFVCSTLSRFSNHRHIRRYITNYRWPLINMTISFTVSVLLLSLPYLFPGCFRVWPVASSAAPLQLHMLQVLHNSTGYMCCSGPAARAVAVGLQSLRRALHANNL